MNWDEGSAKSRLFYRNREHQAAQFQAVAERLGDTTGLTVLDVGCGYGDFIPYIQGNYRGIDADPNTVEEAQRLWPDRDITCTTKITTADVIVAIGAVQCEVTPPDRFLRDCARHARKLLIATGTHHWQHPVEEVHSWLPDAELVDSNDDFYVFIYRKEPR